MKIYRDKDFLPLVNYMKIVEEQDLRYLVRAEDLQDVTTEWVKENEQEVQKSWGNINDQVTNYRLEHDPTYRKGLMSAKNDLLFKIECHQTNDAAGLLHIEHQEKLKQEASGDNPDKAMDIRAILGLISQKNGYQINPATMTLGQYLREYIDLCEFARKKRAEKWQRKG